MWVNNAQAAAMISETPLDGFRVLIVEDDPFAALELAGMVSILGGAVVGPAPTLEDAREMIARSRFNLALLNWHLEGETVHELLCELHIYHDVPVVLTSGLPQHMLPAPLQNLPYLQKPIDLEDLQRVLEGRIPATRRSETALPDAKPQSTASSPDVGKQSSAEPGVQLRTSTPRAASDGAIRRIVGIKRPT